MEFSQKLGKKCSLMIYFAKVVLKMLFSSNLNTVLSARLREQRKRKRPGRRVSATWTSIRRRAAVLAFLSGRSPPTVQHRRPSLPPRLTRRKCRRHRRKQRRRRWQKACRKCRRHRRKRRRRRRRAFRKSRQECRQWRQFRRRR